MYSVYYVNMQAAKKIIKTAVFLNDALQHLTGEKGEFSLHGCTIKYEAKGCFYTPTKYVYDGYAWDVESGKSVKIKHYKSAKGANQHAVRELCEDLRQKGILA